MPEYRLARTELRERIGQGDERVTLSALRKMANIVGFSVKIVLVEKEPKRIY